MLHRNNRAPSWIVLALRRRPTPPIDADDAKVLAELITISNTIGRGAHEAYTSVRTVPVATLERLLVSPRGAVHNAVFSFVDRQLERTDAPDDIAELIDFAGQHSSKMVRCHAVAHPACTSTQALVIAHDEDGIIALEVLNYFADDIDVVTRILEIWAPRRDLYYQCSEAVVIRAIKTARYTDTAGRALPAVIAMRYCPDYLTAGLDAGVGDIVLAMAATSDWTAAQLRDMATLLAAR